MRFLCWLGFHKRESGTEFIRRSDGYPLAAYGTCRRCPKRLNLTYGRQPEPAFHSEWVEMYADQP